MIGATMEIREIIYIKTIADFKNITKAADYLHITQPSLSQSLKNIEEKLGVPLFSRSKRGMTLTEFGERFINDSKKVLRDYGDFIRTIETYNKQTQTRRIGLYKLSYTTPINSLIMKFMAHNNDDNYMIKVEGISELENLLLEDKLDIAIIKYTPIQKKNNQLTYKRLFEERLYVLLHKDHELASRDTLKIVDLKGCRLISSTPSKYPHQMTQFILDKAGVDLEIHTQTNYENLSMIFDLVSQRFGITFASHFVCEYFKRDDVVKVALEEIYDYEVCVVSKKNYDDQFLDFLVREVRILKEV